MPRVRSAVLRKIPPETPRQVAAVDLRSLLLAKPNPDEQYRNRFGRGLTLARIETALRSAQDGSMRDLTDLSRETIDTDPHLAAVLQKRFGAVSSLPWEVTPAQGVNVDRERAELYATVVRDQLKMLTSFSRALNQLAWALFDGRAALEVDWMMRPSAYGAPGANILWQVRGLGWIHPRRMSFGPHREIRVVPNTYSVSGFQPVGVALDDFPLKFIQWLPQLFGDYPEREGLAPRCLYWSFFKRFGARERMILLELFGKPWRIIEVDEDSSASSDDLTAADAVVDGLGSNATARMPRGTRLRVESPPRSAGAIHQETIEESDRQLSKLVLGQTGTTDGVAAGMNSRQALVMQDEQFMILQRDARELSEVIENGLCDAIIELNFGSGALDHAPHFNLRADLPADRKAEIEKLQMAVDAGLWISRNEAYERAGFKIPDENESVVRLGQPPTPASGVSPPREPILFMPDGTPADSQDIEPPARAPEPPSGDPEMPGAPVMAAARQVDSGGGDGGVHVHELARQDGFTDFGGDHRHVFALADGTIVATALDGKHEHFLVSPMADNTESDGVHAHVVRIAGQIYMTEPDEGAHSHQLQMVDTVRDGLHRHQLRLPNGLTLTSLSPGEFLQRISSGGIPQAMRVPGKINRTRKRARDGAT